jgi:hypothetical protein
MMLDKHKGNEKNKSRLQIPSSKRIIREIIILCKEIHKFLGKHKLPNAI